MPWGIKVALRRGIRWSMPIHTPRVHLNMQSSMQGCFWRQSSISFAIIELVGWPALDWKRFRPFLLSYLSPLQNDQMSECTTWPNFLQPRQRGMRSKEMIMISLLFSHEEVRTFTFSLGITLIFFSSMAPRSRVRNSHNYLPSFNLY